MKHEASLLIYIAGPYRASTTWGIECNVFRAREWGAIVAQAGGFPVVPHANTAHYDGLADDAFWLEGTLELLRRCDGVLFLPSWRSSSGAMEEAREAARLGLPVFDAAARPSPPSAIEAWVRGMLARRAEAS